MDRYDPYTDKFLRDTQYDILSTNLASLGTDCISRQAAIDAARDWYEGLICGSFKGLEKRLRALPSAQPELKKGKWIYHIDDLFPAESTKECDQCHAEQPLICDDEFCPHCGAKMEAADGND